MPVCTVIINRFAPRDTDDRLKKRRRLGDHPDQCVLPFADCQNIFEHILCFGNDDNYMPRKKCRPTDHPVGSKEKVEVMAQRVAKGQPIWHDVDRPEDIRKPLDAMALLALLSKD